MQNSIDPAFADHLQCCFYHSNKHPAEQWGVQQPQRWKQLSHKISSSEYFFYSDHIKASVPLESFIITNRYAGIEIKSL
jgi:hypothetical protein